MSLLKRRHILPMLLLVLASAQSTAQLASHPIIRLSSPSRYVTQTEQSSISLEGTVSSQTPLASAQWVNQFGQRGPVTLPANAQGTIVWSITDLPLHVGTNLLAISIADAASHSATLNIAVRRETAPGSAAQSSLPVGSGSWQNRPVVYQLWNGHAVVEGDIILNLTPFTRPASGDEKAVEPNGVERNGLSISYTKYLWPQVGGIYQVPYIETGSSSTLTSAINDFNADFAGLIQFVARSGQANYVNITVDGDGSTEGFSNVGMLGGEQTLECGSGCTLATWLHEMGHTVGLLHEHQRPDRGNYITLQLQNADLPNVPGNFTLFLYDYQTIGLYDYASVMHYGAFDFTQAGLPVIESIPAGIPLSNEAGYSAGDLDQIERLYGTAPSNVTVTTNPVGLKVVVDGVSYPSPHTFSFALNSTHTLNLPADPQNTSPADGSTYKFGNWNDLGARSHTITVSPGTGSLTSPLNEPAVTVYEANFVRLQPFAFDSPAVYPSGDGTIATSPSPTSEYGGTYFTDRTLVSLTLTPANGTSDNFYDWFNLPLPPSDNPHSFYIQMPITQAQAVFVSTPVTIIGGSISGPDTWNPGLSGTVDGAPAFLPEGFSSTYDGSGWVGGTTHMVSVPQTQSPVTLNVYYNFNSWSDSGAISHSVTQPASGSQTINASLTPFYASYTVPPPLGSSNAGCAGGVATSPAGTTNPPDIFDFYEDGSSVTATATANPAFPALAFAGWSGGVGSLSGTTSSQTTVIHAQFVPTANFNLTSTPLGITSLSPSSAVASSSAAPSVTINGTGFVSGATFANWNGNSRTVTFVSSTQLTLQLEPGDLANAGGQDIFVGNSTTNASSQTCLVGAETSFTVLSNAPTPGASSAAFAGSDTSTQGTWTGKYGSDGYLIANDKSSRLPSYAAVSETGDLLYTWAASSSDKRAPQVSSGSAARIASAFYSNGNTSFTFNVNLTDGKMHRVALYLLDWTGSTRAETISILDFNTNTVLDTESYSSFNAGEYASWNIQGHVLIQVKSTGTPNSVATGLFFDTILSSAKYLGADTTTQGTWTGKYGTDGYVIANGTSALPSYAAVSETNDKVFTWAKPTSDPRALQVSSGSASRVASAYYSSGNSTFTIDVNLTDGNTHRVALYLLDWTGSTRAETISVVDLNSNIVLDSESYSGFNKGEWAIWNIKGHVLIQVKNTGTPNGVVSALFFDTVLASAHYVGPDTTTQGTWTGKYGSDGFVIANGSSQPPGYATVSEANDKLFTWANSTSDPRALQTSSGSSTRIASAYYSNGNSAFTINVNLTDNNTHQLALYLLDWTGSTRAETISVLDAHSSVVLDSESYSNFNNGEWAVWNIQGNVIIQVKNGGTPNAVVSGIFFAP